LWGVERKYWLVLVFTWMLTSGTFCQESSDTNFRFRWTPDFLWDPGPLIRARITQNLDYFISVSALQFVNKNCDKNPDHMIFLQSLKYKVTVSRDSSFSFSQNLFHDLGGQCFFDSITRIHPDETKLEYRLLLRLWKRLSLSFDGDLSTRLLNSYEYLTDLNGRSYRVCSQSFLTPVVFRFSVGIRRNWPGFGELTMGISSAKLTCIRDHGIFERLKIHEFCGIPETRDYRFEYGLSLRLLVDEDLFKRIHWNCDLLLFKNYLCPVDVSVKNLFSVRINKFIMISLQTKILYEEKTSKNLQVENQLNIGLSIHL
jgi:hypothetical protein